jgi:hypothetical protein
MFWFWLNIPLAAAFFGAWYGIPMWKILKHPDWSCEPAAGQGGQLAGPQPVLVVNHADHPVGVTPVGAGAGRHR